MKRTLLFILGIVAALSSNASDWKSHFSYDKDILGVERIGNTVYALSSGKLFSYDVSSGQYATMLKTTQNDSIIKIAKDPDNSRLILVRSDFGIDIFDGINYQSISALRNVDFLVDKEVNDIHISDGFAYLSVSFGLIVVDMDKAEIKATCLFRFPVYSTSKMGEYLYAATSKGSYRISENLNLQNFNDWEHFSFVAKYEANDWASFDDANIRKIIVFNSRLYVLVPGNSLFHLDGDILRRNSELTISPTSLELKNGKLLVYDKTKLWIYKEGEDSPLNYAVTSLQCISPDINEDEYWVGIPSQNLSKIKFSGTTFSYLKQKLKPQGPLTNYPFYMAYTGGKVRVAGGGYYYTQFPTIGQLSEYDSDGWYNYTPSSQSVRNYVSVDANPADPTNVFMPSWGQGVYEFKNRTYVTTHDQTNSSLIDIFGKSGYVRVNGLKFEGPDKFWVANSMVPKALHVFYKEGGVWKSYGFDHPEIYVPHTANRDALFTDLLVDSKGNKWVVTILNSLVFIFNENGTIEDTSDDKKRLITKFYDQDGTGLIMRNIYRIKEDKRGNVWIVSNTGLFMVKNSDDIFNDEIVFTRTEFATKDASGSIDYLLGRSQTNDLAIDAANRKWVATEENGVYLISDNGLDLLAHFTVDNGALPSNRVLSIAIDDKNHVFIGTDNGIVEYSGALATDLPAETNAVYVYPNPVPKGFPRNVAVKGLAKNSYVKIVTETNELISSGVASKDGTFEWNGDDVQGRRVLPGVYYIVGTSQDGTEEGIQSSLRVIN